MNLREFSLAMRMRADRMILLWPAGQTNYATSKARAVTQGILRAADGVTGAIENYYNSSASWFQREPLALMLSELRRARTPVSYAAGAAAREAAPSIILPDLRGDALALVGELARKAESLAFLEGLHDDFWGSWTDFVFDALDAAITALGWVGGLVNDLLPSLSFAIPDWALWGSVGVGVYWFFLRK